MASKKDKAVNEPTPEPKTDWKFSPDDTTQASPDANSSSTKRTQTTRHKDSVVWTASEYVSHEKGAGWFIGLAIGGGAIAVLVFIITRDYVSTSIVATMAIIFGVFAARKPQTLEYTINQDGLQIGPKHYPYDQFKSFAIMDEGAVFSILLLPLKRFMPSISIYYDAKDESNIVDVLSGYLAMEERSHDLTDQLMRKIRF